MAARLEEPPPMAVPEQQQQQQQQQQLALKCPRCDSSNTKFCYYNNYSLSQPRHFCKACKRYWTRGGTLRNVPVGGGCRKNKRGLIKRQPSPAPPVTSTTITAATTTTTTTFSDHMMNTISIPNYPHDHFSSALGRGFSSGLSCNNGSSLHFIQELVSSSAAALPSSNAIRCILPMGSSNSSSTATVVPSFLIGGDLHLKDAQMEYFSPLLFQDPGASVGYNNNIGSAGLAMKDQVKVVQGQNINIPGGGWNFGYQNHPMDQQVRFSSDPPPSYYGNISNVVTDNWHEPTNTDQSSVPSLI